MAVEKYLYILLFFKSKLINSEIADQLCRSKTHKWQIYLNIIYPYFGQNRAERHDLKSRFLLFILLSSSLFFWEGREKGKRITKVLILSHAFLLDLWPRHSPTLFLHSFCMTQIRSLIPLCNLTCTGCGRYS